MDPDATLTELREALRMLELFDGKAAASEERGESHLAAKQFEYGENYARAAAEYAEDLDDWLSKGGFLPSAWTAHRSTTVKE